MPKHPKAKKSTPLQPRMDASQIYFVFYNFARVHSSLRMSPAMVAGIETPLWEIEDVVRLLDAA